MSATQLDKIDVINCSLQDLISATDEAIKASLSERNLLNPEHALDRNAILLRAVKAREEAKKNPDLASPETAMKRLLSLSVDEISLNSSSDPHAFRDLMVCAQAFDPSLPPPPTSSEPNVLASAAMMWKLKSLENIQNHNVSGHINAFPLPEAPPLLPNVLNLESLLATEKRDGKEPNIPNEVASPPQKRAKSAITVGGIAIVDENGKSTAQRAQKLGPYPSKAPHKPSLCVTELIGSKLLRALLQRGRCLEATVAEVNWFRGQKGELMAAEAEAFFLARILHFGLQDFNEMETALEKCSWMEIAIRRLYALIYVENAMRTMNANRATAWTAGNPILEANPGTPALLPEFDSSLARTLAMNAKAQNAFKSMKTINSKPNRTHRRDQPEGRKDSNRQ